MRLEVSAWGWFKPAHHGIARRLVSTPVFAKALRSALEENPCTEPSASPMLPCLSCRMSLHARGAFFVSDKIPGVTCGPP